MQVLEINNNKIINIYDVDNVLKLEQITNNELIQAEGSCLVGDDIRHYSIMKNKLQKKDVNTLVNEKLISLNEDEKIKDNKIVKKTKKELWQEDKIEIDNTKKFAEDEETLIDKTKLELYQDDLITTEQFLLHIQEITLNCYKNLFAKTDECIAMRSKRQLLGIWTDADEEEFQQKMQEYNELVSEYKQRKQDCINLINNKQGLIDYYNDVLLPRLNELNNC